MLGQRLLMLLGMTVVCTLCLVALVAASPGDRSFVFQKCLNNCEHANCTSKKALRAFAAHQPAPEHLLGWTCEEECRHMCMWKTVDAYQKDGTPVPQFYGKWPFIRVLGIQEPASAFFSLLNALSNVVMLVVFMKNVPSTAPMYSTWVLSALVAVNAWTWATIFHSKDTDFTEAMDYLSATGNVVFNLLIMFKRVMVFAPWQRFWLVAAVISGCYAKHVHFLMFVRFDYGYNMLVMVAAGIVNSLSWLLWCAKHRRNQPYVWKAAATITAVNMLFSLEAGDFLPLLWVLDAHSLWHLGTVPLPLLWFSFAIDDCLHLLNIEEERSKTSLKEEPEADGKKEQ